MRRSLQLKKIIANAPYVYYFAQPQQLQRADQHIANSRNSCLPTRIHPVYLKKHRRHFTQNLHGKRCINWHMISFLHFGSEKRVYAFPSGSKLADARKEMATYMGVY